MEDHLVPKEVPIKSIDVTESFNKLSDKEKAYAYYMSKACWEFAPLILDQRSGDAKDISWMFIRMFDDVKEYQLNDDSLNDFLNYWCFFMGNFGEYQSFGDKKLIPQMKKEDFTVLVEKFLKEPLTEYDLHVIDRIYSLKDSEKMYGYPPSNYTAYYYDFDDESECKMVNEDMKTLGIDPLNNMVERLFKKKIYQINIPSIYTKRMEYEVYDRKYIVNYGYHQRALTRVVKNLRKAKSYSESDERTKMLDSYCDHFILGDINFHKDSQRHWVKDKQPPIEVNLGAIETYVDPAGIRAEFEAFVSIVNKSRSKTFADLVSMAPKLLTLFPWGKVFEKDKFLEPDYSALEVLTFTAAGIPAGINIPNYDDIRQKDGFKNVSLENIIKSSLKATDKQTPFLPSDVDDLYKKNVELAYDIEVAGHELLGHGSGKMFMENKDGTKDFNPDNIISPLTKEPIKTWYKIGETYDSVFGSIASAYEECRAECAGMYLGLYNTMTSIFGVETESHHNDVSYTIWVNMLLSGIKGLIFYSPEKKKWLQAHCQARYVILKAMDEVEGLVEWELDTEGKHFTFRVNRNIYETKGREKVQELLMKLQVYKATADIKEAKKFFEFYSDPSEFHLSLLPRIKHNKKERGVFTQPTIIQDWNEHSSVSYPDTKFGMIKSFITNLKEPLSEHFKI